MAGRVRRFFQAPLRTILLVHLLAAGATLGFLALAVRAHVEAAASGTTTGGAMADLGEKFAAVTTGEGGLTLLVVLVIPLAAVTVASLVLGLVYGRWGLPGYLQGRAVFVVPFLAAGYFIGGAAVLGAMMPEHATWNVSAVGGLVTTWAGGSLVLIYAALSTSAVGVGWAISLAITTLQRRRGKWETIGYVERTA